MKLKYLFFIFFISPVIAVAQIDNIEGVKIENYEFMQQGESVSIAFDLMLDQLEVKSEQMYFVTPRLSSVDGQHEMALEPVLIVGGRRSKMLERNLRLKGDMGLDPMPQQIIKRAKGLEQQISYRVMIPYEVWMRKSTVILFANITGCASCDEGSDEVLIAENLIKDVFIPKVTYIVPIVQPSKRKANFSGVINFIVDKADILLDYKNNFVPIMRANDLVSEVKAIEEAFITSIEIKGYASPEASVLHNKDLSVRRANAFADYISGKHRLERNSMNVSGEGEDWEMLRLQVAASELKSKQQILDIIRTVADPDDRDAPLKKLEGGSVYQTLLREYYPQIRRIEMNLDYEVKENFNLEEVKKKYKDQASEMALNEYYFLSQHYQAGSDPFNALFAEAIKHHADDVIVNLNVSVAEIEKQNYQEAIKVLLPFEDDPKVWNTLGVAYAKMEQYENAKNFFTKAAANGDVQAKGNREQLVRFLEDQ